MISVGLFCQVLALVLLMLAALNIPSHPRINLGWWGMFFWLLSLIMGRWPQ